MNYLQFINIIGIMNRKIVCSLTFLTLAFTLISLSSCSSTSEDYVKNVIDEAQKMSREDLYKKAMEELKGKTMYFIGNSSRLTTAKEYFINYLKGNKFNETTKEFEVSTEVQSEFKYYNPNFDGKIEFNQPINNKIFSFVSSDIRSSSHKISMVLIQDGNQIQSKMINTNYLLNYVPKDWEGAYQTNGNPFALQSLNKVFEFNNQGTKEYKNVWDFVNENSKFYFMNIQSEPVGKNFFYMLTNKHYSSIMEDAFNKYTGDDKASIQEDIDSLASEVIGLGLENENAKYSLAFIKRFKHQADTRTYLDDAPICNHLATKNSANESGLLVYSKLRNIRENEEDISSKNITIAAYQDGYIGIGGYMYKHYLQILKTSPFPWTSCALIDFISTTQYGFKPWGKDIGGYCSDTKTNTDHSKDGYVDEVSVYDCKNDRGYDWWINQETGGKLVIEEPAYCAKVDYLLGAWVDAI
jgi:hypothetical protein